MTEHPNAVLTRRAYEAFAKGDLDTVKALMTEDAAWHMPGANLLSGDYTGRGRVLEFFGKVFDLSGGTFKAEVIDILADDERAVVIHQSSATRNNKTLDTRTATE